MSEVFVLGAGFSRAISDLMPTLKDLTALHLMARMGTFQQGGHDDIMGAFGDNIEHFLSYLSQVHPWLSEAQNLQNRVQFLNTSSELAVLLLQRQNDAIETLACPEWLTDLVSLWEERRSIVLTFNQDTLVEKAYLEAVPLEKRSHRTVRDLYPVPIVPVGQRVGGVWGAEPPSTFRLLKLHGSLNWYYSGASQFYGESIYEVRMTPRWNSDAPDELVASVPDKVPLIVPPTTEKNSFFANETLRAQWTLAGQSLTAADQWFFMGYSLPETDLMVRFLMAPKAEGKIVYPVNTDLSIVDHYCRLLKGAEVCGSYIDSDHPVQRFVAELKTRLE